MRYFDGEIFVQKYISIQSVSKSCKLVWWNKSFSHPLKPENFLVLVRTNECSKTFKFLKTKGAIDEEPALAALRRPACGAGGEWRTWAVEEKSLTMREVYVSCKGETLNEENLHIWCTIAHVESKNERNLRMEVALWWYKSVGGIGMEWLITIGYLRVGWGTGTGRRGSPWCGLMPPRRGAWRVAAVIWPWLCLCWDVRSAAQTFQPRCGHLSVALYLISIFLKWSFSWTLISPWAAWMSCQGNHQCPKQQCCC